MGSQQKRPDFVLAIKEENLPQVDLYLDNLQLDGLEYEEQKGQEVDLIFIKLFISEGALNHFSHLYDIGTEDTAVSSRFLSEPVFKTGFPNPLADNDPGHRGQLTEAEKIMIINKVLQNTKYGENDDEIGLSKLIDLKIIETAYPLHDGPITADGTNTRSLLYRFWSQFPVTHVQQPLDLICKYYGNEVAFYFAWLEYFNIMLIVPSVLGALAFLAGLSNLTFGDPAEVREVCENNEVLCPLCEEKKGCTFPKIHKFCSLAQWTYVFDNDFTSAFAIFMSFWVTVFIIVWRRKENKLKMRWNCVNDVHETDIRQEYLKKATHKRLNIMTGEMDLIIPRSRKILLFTCTLTACALLIGVIMVVVCLNMILIIMFIRMCSTSGNEYLKRNGKVLGMFLSSLLQACVIKIFEKLYHPGSVWVTKFENPKTQSDFDNSVLYKRYLLAMMNHYIPVVYLAFIKGHLLTLPHNMSFLRKDSCQPCNCIVALCVQLAMILTLRLLFGNIIIILLPHVKKYLRYIKRICLGKHSTEISYESNIPQWEEEYYLEDLDRYSVTNEFSEMVIRYGYVAFFSEPFPLGALCTLMNNLIEVRSDAYKFVVTHKRSVPIEKSGIGAWNGILRSLIYFGTAMNAFVVAFTSDWIPKILYRLHAGEGSLKGYVNSSLSKYQTDHNEKYDDIKIHSKFCYFRGHFSPPGEKDPYSTTPTYWMILTFRFLTVFVFEHIILLCNSILEYLVPYKPESVELQLDLNRQSGKTVRLKEFIRKVDKRLPKNINISKCLQGIGSHEKPTF